MLSVGSLFTGIGMLDYGLHLAGLTDHRWVCEQDEWRRERILAQRFPDAVRYDDVRDAGYGWEPVELIVGGFPCKGVSTAGKRTGFDHPETVLWREMRRAIGELRPRYVLVENVSNLLALHDGAVWGEVLGDLAALGFDVVWDCLPAAAVGAPHLRDRVFAVAAHADGEDEQRDAGERREPDGWPDVGGGVGAAADAECDSVRQQPVAEPRSSRATVAGRAGAAPADAAGERWAEGEPAQERSGVWAHAGAGRGVAVEWGPYEPAIRRWEAIVGPAPEPLVRRVDARTAARVERSRLAALGDGVQVQVGYLAGRYIRELEERRVTAFQGNREPEEGR